MRLRTYKSIAYQIMQGEESGIKGRDAKAWFWQTAEEAKDGPYKSAEEAEQAAEAWLRGEG